MTKQIQIRIVGQVQGVSFRATTKREAEKLNLLGWVRNNEDESVEILAQGEEENLKRFIVWCWEGPTAARVDDVEIQWGEISEKLKYFAIV